MEQIMSDIDAYMVKQRLAMPQPVVQTPPVGIDEVE